MGSFQEEMVNWEEWEARALLSHYSDLSAFFLTFLPR